MRQKHIIRKKRIIHALGDYWHYKFEGELDRSKIHCSCGMCSRYRKTNNKARRRRIYGNYAPSYNPSARDRRKLEAMLDQEKEYLQK